MWHPENPSGLTDEIADLFEILTGVPDRDDLEGPDKLRIVGGDTGQDTMREAKRAYTHTDKGKAARARYDAQAHVLQAKAARERKRRAEGRTRRRACACPVCGAPAGVACTGTRGAPREAVHRERIPREVAA